MKEGIIPEDSKRSSQRTPVSTILTPIERSRVDAAAQGLCDPLHRESLDEVLSDLRQQKANLVLISVTRYGSQSSSRVAAMVREFPRVPAVALLTETQSSTPHATLALGQLGIRTLVDARQPTGWQTLRNILASQGSSDLLRSALTQISLDLPGVSKDCWRFFELLFDPSPRISTATASSIWWSPIRGLTTFPSSSAPGIPLVTGPLWPDRASGPAVLALWPRRCAT